MGKHEQTLSLNERRNGMFNELNQKMRDLEMENDNLKQRIVSLVKEYRNKELDKMQQRVEKLKSNIDDNAEKRNNEENRLQVIKQAEYVKQKQHELGILELDELAKKQTIVIQEMNIKIKKDEDELKDLNQEMKETKRKKYVR